MPVVGGLDGSYFSFNGSDFYASLHTSGLDIYQFNGLFYRISQRISISEARGIAFSAIGDDFYLAIAVFQGRPQRFETNSSIFKMSSGRFLFFQSVPTMAATSVLFLSANDHTFLCFSNYQNDARESKVNSSVYLFNSVFVKHQDIATIGALNVKGFVSGSESIILFANYYDSSRNLYETQSSVWLLNSTTNRFTFVQTINTIGASDWGISHVFGRVFCAVANLRSTAGSLSVTSAIYAWNGTTRKLDLFQYVPTFAVGSWCGLDIDSQFCFLSVSNGVGSSGYVSSSSLFCLDQSLNRFAWVFDVPTVAARRCAVYLPSNNNRPTIGIISSSASSVFYEVCTSFVFPLFILFRLGAQI